MSIVRTKTELQAALKRKEHKIIVKGPLADKYIKARKKKKKMAVVVGASVAIIGGIAAIPFTGGSSAVAGGSVATGLICGATVGTTAATITMSTTELAIILGVTATTILGVYGIKKGSKVRVTTKKGDIENTIEITPNYKD